MNYWLAKTEPETFSWDNLVEQKTAAWDGVRNFQARSNMKKMAPGDQVFIYHTGNEKAIIGIAKVVKAAYPEPADAEWVAVDLSAGKKLKNPVTLAQIKADKRLKEMALARVPRLSVQPVEKEEFDLILKLSEEI